MGVFLFPLGIYMIHQDSLNHWPNTGLKPRCKQNQPSCIPNLRGDGNRIIVIKSSKTDKTEIRNLNVSLSARIVLVIVLHENASSHDDTPSGVSKGVVKAVAPVLERSGLRLVGECAHVEGCFVKGGEVVVRRVQPTGWVHEVERGRVGSVRPAFDGSRIYGESRGHIVTTGSEEASREVFTVVGQVGRSC